MSQIKLLLLSILFALAGVLPTRGAAANHRTLTLFVAPNGDDRWRGHSAEPNRKRTDGPLATIAHALEVSRAAKTSGAQACSIILRGGTYFTRNTVVLKPEDSGLTLLAYKNEKPLISAGLPITNWSKVPGDPRGLWVAEIPEVAKGQLFFRELWVNGRRAVRARHPNKGYLQVESLPDATPNWEKGQTRFTFKGGDLKAWPSITNAEIVVMSRWVESRLPVSSLNETQRIVSFARRSVFQLGNGDRYYLEHAFEALDEPGEWYLDAASGKLFYLPRPGEQKLQAVAPVRPQVMRLEGSTNGYVDGVTFSGITFSHAEWYFADDAPGVKKPAEPAVGGFPQAAVGVPAALYGEGVRNCVFTNCNCTHAGGYGLELARACRSNVVVRCAFTDLGAGGIKLGETACRSNPEELTRGNCVQDCTISDGGHLFLSGEGIWVGQSADNKLTHNLIHDFYYTGISLGWSWGYGLSYASNNLIAFNHVHHIGVKSDGDGPVLSDMGGIYTLGLEPGTRIVNNLWHDIAGLRYGGWGIYFDEGSSGIVAESNVVYRTTHGGFHQHYGATNVLRNNIFAFAREHQLQRTRPEPHRSFSFETNIVYFDTGVLLGGDWSNDNYLMNWNLYWDARTNAKPESMTFAGVTLDAWRKRGHDTNSILADPLFAAPEKGNFQLRAASPALKLGFHPIDLRAVGPRR